MTLGIVTFSITTLGIQGSFPPLSINYTQHNNILSAVFYFLVCWMSLCWVSLCWLSLCSVALWWISSCWLSLCWVALWWMSLCWKSLCWVSRCRLGIWQALPFLYFQIKYLVAFLLSFYFLKWSAYSLPRTYFLFKRALFIFFTSCLCYKTFCLQQSHMRPILYNFMSLLLPLWGNKLEYFSLPIRIA